MAAARPCGDTCNSAADSGFMCLNFDSTLHSANNNDNRLVSSRVWMCDVCEQAPAAVACKADAAALCVTCDADIHSANHLAHRHLRVPIPTFLNSQQQDAVPGSWLLPTPTIKTGDLFFSQTDAFQVQQDHNLAMDQIKASAIPVVNDENSFHFDFSPHKLPTFSFQSESLSHSVSSSSVEVGVVPDGNSMSSDISYPLGIAMTDASVPLSAKTSSNQEAQDREARVSRYREKRKKRRFQKTVRYVSRKIYAESRPRIKGRFVKRSQIQHQVVEHHMYNSAAAAAAACTASSHLLRVDRC